MKTLNELQKEIEKTQVIILAGGAGKRLGLPDIPKALVRVGGKTLIEREIELYYNCGFKDFKILIGHLGEKIKNYLGDGSKLGVSIKYSEDPPVKRVGKGKALKNALENQVIDKNKRGIITFPDDLKLDKYLPIKFIAHHLYGRKVFNTWASVLLISSTTYPYGVAKVDYNGLVLGFEEKPKIHLPTNIGVCIMEPQAFEMIIKEIDINHPQPIEFEATILPKIAKMRKLYSMTIQGDDKTTWIPINTLKELEYADKILTEKKFS